MSAILTQPEIELAGVAVGPAARPESPDLAGIDWQIHPGDYWAVTALSGWGKSNLLLTAAGLQLPLRGSHSAFGLNSARSYDDERIAIRRRVGFVFEDGGRLFHHLTLAENIALPLAYHEEGDAQAAADRVDALLTATELGNFAKRLPSRVGRPWRQRAALARALATQPQVLFLDNPVSALDARHLRWWIEFLGALNAGHALLGRRPLTLVIAVEELQPWRDHARQFALLHERRLLTYASRDEFLAAEAIRPRERPAAPG